MVDCVGEDLDFMLEQHTWVKQQACNTRSAWVVVCVRCKGHHSFCTIVRIHILEEQQLRLILIPFILYNGGNVDSVLHFLLSGW